MLSLFTPKDASRAIAKRARQHRLQLNITQQELAERSGVSFGSVKRFEQSGRVSLENLLQIAVVLGSLEDFEELFKSESYHSIEEMIDQETTTKRERARRHDS